MLNQIKIANLLLTRKCNLSCFYCRISAEINYKDSPYPDKNYYFKNEKNEYFWCELIDRLQKHNKDMFLILYGGEPFLYKGLDYIIKHCNKIDIPYTIISSCNQGILPLIDEFFKKVEYVKGFSVSVDPGYYKDLDLFSTDDTIHKSYIGYRTLQKLYKEGKVGDPVAEITVSDHNLEYLVETVKRLSEVGITSSITTLDIAKNNYYDFSTITDEKSLVKKDNRTKEIFDELKRSDFLIHMKSDLLDRLYDNLPANLDCHIEKNLHNICIESDGRPRLCLRIKGLNIENDMLDFINVDGIVTPTLNHIIKLSKEKYCEGCIHTCYMMSQLESDGIINH